MLFHTFSEIQDAAPARPLRDIEAAVPHAQRVKRGTARASTPAMVWAGVMVIVFLFASLVAYQMGFSTAATVCLNVSVVLISTSSGAFLGEKLALDKLLS